MDKFYYFDNQSVVGAHTLQEMQEMYAMATINSQTLVIRIIVPKYKRQLNQLERLLILAHKPTENGTVGIVGKTPVDDCLEFIRGEIKELVTDF